MSETQTSAVPAGKPQRSTNDGLAAALLDIDELHKRIAQVAEGVGQNEAGIIARIDDLERRVEVHNDVIRHLEAMLEERKNAWKLLAENHDGRLQKLEGK